MTASIESFINSSKLEKILPPQRSLSARHSSGESEKKPAISISPCAAFASSAPHQPVPTIATRGISAPSSKGATARAPGTAGAARA